MCPRGTFSGPGTGLAVLAVQSSGQRIRRQRDSVSRSGRPGPGWAPASVGPRWVSSSPRQCHATPRTARPWPFREPLIPDLQAWTSGGTMLPRAPIRTRCGGRPGRRTHGRRGHACCALPTHTSAATTRRRLARGAVDQIRGRPSPAPCPEQGERGAAPRRAPGRAGPGNFIDGVPEARSPRASTSSWSSSSPSKPS